MVSLHRQTFDAFPVRWKPIDAKANCECRIVPKIKDVCHFLDSFAPTRLAEDWDNVGLLAGDPDGDASRIMTCLTITSESADEAIARKADLIVSHHPLPFRPLKRLTTDSVPSRLLWNLIRAGVSIYSPHTGFDSASQGINQTLGQKIGMTNMAPLVAIPDDPDGLGAGRVGEFPGQPAVRELIDSIKKKFSLVGIHVIGNLDNKSRRAAVACGSGGSFLSKAIAAGCDTFVTGETTFHTCLEAKANNVSMILLGHFASERFAVEELADQIANEFSGLNDPQFEVWASQKESDPIIWA